MTGVRALRLVRGGAVRATAWVGLALALGPAPALAQQPGGPFTPASPQARAISDLFVLVLILAAVVFVIVEGLLIYVLLRFRARTGDGEPRAIFENKPIEITWTAIPIVVLAILFVLMLPVMGVAENAPPDAYTVTVVGHQFWWEFRYPQPNAVAANEMHVPAGEKIRVLLQSADVIHSFWIPRLNGKMDLIPGQTNEWQIQAEAPGEYVGQCAELCGVQHAWMLLRVFAQPRPEFDAWVAQQAAPAAAPTDPTAQRGQQIFSQQACGNCHAIRGTSAAGGVAPDLTHVGSRTTLAAGALTNTPDNLQRWLHDPQKIKPGANMPTFKLSDADVQALASYLEGLK
jgi:cytochrome c oxidase subunit II